MITAIRSLTGFGNRVGPSPDQCSTACNLFPEASPKAISGRTSYLHVRLEFHPYPHLISVIYFRNYDPASGGSQRHPHSQIIGLEDYDYRDNINRENLLGTIFHEDENCFASLSSYPICGMGELNVTLKTDGHIDTFADTIRKIANYILHDFPIPCSSYNLFFYHMKHIHVKLFPRYMASPLYMGYRITHVMDNESSQNIISTLTSAKYFG